MNKDKINFQEKVRNGALCKAIDKLVSAEFKKPEIAIQNYLLDINLDLNLGIFLKRRH